MRALRYSILKLVNPKSSNAVTRLEKVKRLVMQLSTYLLDEHHVDRKEGFLKVTAGLPHLSFYSDLFMQLLFIVELAPAQRRSCAVWLLLGRQVG